MLLRIEGLGFRVQRFGFTVEGLGLTVRAPPAMEAESGDDVTEKICEAVLGR